MGRLTVLHVGAFPFPLHQGSQVYVAGLTGALAARGHRVLLACRAGGRGRAPEGVEVVRARAMPGEVEHSGPHWSRIPGDLLLAATVRRVLRTAQVDLVHAHNVEGPVVAALAGASMPVIYDQHTVMGEELPAYLGPAGAAAAPVGRWLDRLAVRYSDAAVALSEQGARALPPDLPVAVLPPAVDPADLAGADPAGARSRWRLEGRDWVVYAGNTDGYQDVAEWFEAMSLLPGAGLLLVTGSDTAPWKARADSLQIGPERLRLVHTRSFDDVRDALSASAVAVCPRATCPGFPVKLLNQLGMGVPTVAARGSARDLPGVVAVPNHDPGAMAVAIGRLLADSARRRKLGAAAAEAVASGWTWEARAAEVEQFYRQVLG